MAKLIKGSVEPTTCYAIGFAYGISRARHEKYVRILVSTGQTTSSRSSYSLFEEPQLLKDCGIVKENLDFPAEGDREKREALKTAVKLGERVFWSVGHCPVMMPDSDSVLSSISGVSLTAQDAETDAAFALRRRYSQCEKIAPVPSILAEQKDYITPDFVSKSEVFAAVNGGEWQDVLKGLL